MHIIINGKKYKIYEGETILSVAKRNNIEIPTLCYDDRFEPKTSCFLCVVEDKATGKLVPSCSTFVNDGMELETQNTTVVDARKTTLELLLSEHDASCFSPCKTNCPSNIDARDYVLYTSKKEEYKGFRIIRKKNPLIATLGRVCPAFCEDACNRGKVDETVAIRLLKKQIADITYDNHYEELLKDEKLLRTELKAKQTKIYNIAIVGGGPAGISASYYLALNGHNITIYDENPKLGGMLRYSIPAYRLPREELDREINAILALGIKVENKRMSANEIKELSKKNDFVILATGTWEDTKIVNVGDFNNMEIESALSYLKRMSNASTDSTNKEPNSSGKDGEVLIIGGGNTAFDSARTALRRGAKKVTIAYRRTISAMPAEKIEIEEAIEEGVKIVELVSPKNIFNKGEKNFEMLFSFMKETDELDSRGRKKIVAIGKEDTMKFDKLIYAAGQHVNRSFVDAINDLNKENILFAGDAKTGASTVIQSVASGRKTAEFILSLQNKDEMSFHSSRRSGVLPARKLPAETPQIKPNYLSPKERISGDIVYEMPYKTGKSEKEAKRCLNCGCGSVDNCDLRLYSQEYDADADILKIKLPHKPVRTVDADFSPYLLHDNSKCIKCGQCIDVCTKVSGQSVLSFIDRGYDTIVSSTPDDKIVDCSSCGACLDVCPTGAFSEKISKHSYIETKIKEITCTGCVLNCSLYLRYSRDNELMYVRGNRGEICKHIRWEDTRVSASTKTLGVLDEYSDRVIKDFDINNYDSLFAYKYCPKGDNPALFYQIENLRKTGRVFHVNNIKQMQGIEFNNALLVINALDAFDEGTIRDFKEILNKYKNLKVLALHTNLDNMQF